MNSSTLTPDDLEFLDALGRQLTCESTDSRAHPRVELSMPFEVQPADSSRRDDVERLGVTVNVSRGGFLGEMVRPLSIGDHYRVSLVSATAEPIEAIGRCLRCAFLDEERFEVVLRFLAPLEPGVLPEPC